MARYKPTDRDQIRMIPIDLKSQLIPGSFEFTLDKLIEEVLDISIFDHRYNNDKTGASAYDPKILLKIILMAYSRGVTRSRDIERLCHENIVFMALACDTRPHFTTIASFVAKLPMEIEDLFSDVLAICNDMNLIGKEMFAIDGCKIPSNASKEWSGTTVTFGDKKAKMEKVVKRLLKKHNDGPPRPEMRKAEEKRIKTFNQNIEKYKKWLAENQDKKGKRGNLVQSNVTDNDTAKLKSSKGVLQGVTAVAMADRKFQIVTGAMTIGQNDERPTVPPMVEKARERFARDPFETAKLSGDTGFCDESNLRYLYENGIDAYIPDQNFRKRDERFENADRHYPADRKKKPDKFHPEDFVVDPVAETVTCPAGKKMRTKSPNPKKWGIPAIRFQAQVKDCKRCVFRRRCLRNEDQPTPRQFVWFKTKSPEHQPYTKRMIKKIDTEEGRHEYSKRLAIIEPVFANITYNLGLRRFSVRGKAKITAQWLMFCIVHNIGKIQRYGTIG